MSVALYIIREEIFTLVELHGIQMKCGVKDHKTKKGGNSKLYNLK